MKIVPKRTTYKHFLLILAPQQKIETMKLTQQSLLSIEHAIQKAIGRYECNSEQPFVTDIHLQPDATSGQLTIYNDDDEVLAQAMVKEWAGYEGDDFAEQTAPTLRNVLNKMNKNNCFEKVTILKPYSFVLIDEDKGTISELLLMDDDMLLIDDELLKGLDKELDDFLEGLLKE